MSEEPSLNDKTSSKMKLRGIHTIAKSSPASRNNFKDIAEESQQRSSSSAASIDEENGTLVIAFDIDGNEKWIPKAKLLDIGSTFFNDVNEDRKSNEKRGCGAKSRCQIVILVIQVIVNVVGAAVTGYLAWSSVTSA